MDRRRLIPVIIGIAMFLIWRFQLNSRIDSYTELNGTTMGPIQYQVKYQDEQGRNFQSSVDSLLRDFNQSMSTYIADSEISQFNQSDSFNYQSPYFYPVLQLSKEVYEATGGAFDPTVGPLVNAYGFGPGKKRSINALDLDSLRQLVGFDKVKFDTERVIKEAGVVLDFSAIAKGYGVDVVGEFLESRGIVHYMVEIGGEVRCRGKNPEGMVWRIGIEDPTVSEDEQRLFASAIIQESSMATSGNYRNFYVEDGKKYVHTISPFTGKPVQHSLLSASVITADCMEADALATGFMVLGLERSLEIVKQMDSVEAFFIYADEAGDLKRAVTPGISDFIRIK